MGEPIVKIHDLLNTYISKERTGIFGGTKRAVEALKRIHLDISPGEILGPLMPLLGYGLHKATERKVRVDGTLAEF